MSVKVNLRSPFYKKYNDTNLSYVVLEVFIATGYPTLPTGDPQYELTKYTKGSDTFVVFELSELARDYISTDFDGNYNNTPFYLFTNARLYNASDTQIGSTLLDAFVAMDGYGYMEEGINPELSRGKLISNDVIWRPEDENIRIPVFNNDAVDIVVLNGNEVLRSLSYTATGLTTYMLRYVSVSGDVSADNYKQRILSDGGTFENNPLLFDVDNYVDINLVDTIRVYQNNTYEQVKVKTMQCDKYPDRKITFVNKFGAFQDVYFFAKEIESIKTTSDSYKSNVVDYSSLTYNQYKHQYQSYDVQGRESLKLNTGYVTEDYNEVLKQMMLSEQVWYTKTTDEESTIYPVTPVTSSLTYKTSLNDKLVEYTIDFDFAFDKIQNIR